MPRDITSAGEWVQRYFEEIESDWSRVKDGFTLEVTAPETTYFIKDDFGPGASATNVGELGWQSGGGSSTYTTNASGHPGIVRLSSSATINTYSYVRLANSGGGNIMPGENFDLRWVFRLNDNDADTQVRLGWAADASANPANNAMSIEKLFTDTQWFPVTRASSTTTRGNALATCDTGWHKIRIRRIDATRIGFTFDSQAEIQQTANVPTVALNPFVSIYNNTAVAKTVDLDFFSLRIDGLSR